MFLLVIEIWLFKANTSNIAEVQILRHLYETCYIDCCVYVIQYFNVNIHIPGVLVFLQATIAIPWNIPKFHIHVFFLKIHGIFK